MIDRVCGALLEVCGAGCVAVVPPSVRVPDGVLRTLEDPPSGGPLAGIDAGLRALSVGDDVLVVVVSVDAPGVGAFLPALLEPALGEGVEGRIVRGGDPEPFDQYLMGVYRAGALRRILDEAVAALESALRARAERRTETTIPTKAPTIGPRIRRVRSMVVATAASAPDCGSATARVRASEAWARAPSAGVIVMHQG